MKRKNPFNEKDIKIDLKYHLLVLKWLNCLKYCKNTRLIFNYCCWEFCQILIEFLTF